MQSQYPNATFTQSPNSNSGRRQKITTVTLHGTDGQPKLDRAVEHLCKPSSQVSAHFLIGQQGEIVQLVKLEDTAWHCKGANGYSIGIEHIARSVGELSHDDPGLQFTQEQYKASVELVSWLLEKYNLTPENVLGHSDMKDSDGNYLSTHRDCPWMMIDHDKYFTLLNQKIANQGSDRVS